MGHSIKKHFAMELVDFIYPFQKLFIELLLQAGCGARSWVNTDEKSSPCCLGVPKAKGEMGKQALNVECGSARSKAPQKH